MSTEDAAPAVLLPHRQAHLDAVIDGREVYEQEVAATDRYALVERSSHDSSLFVTGHKSAATAAEAWASQEYPEDWLPEVLVDLDHGTRYRGDLQVVWTPLDVPAEPQWRQTACALCGTDIEGELGGDDWSDRGGNDECGLVEVYNEEIGQREWVDAPEGQRHTPVVESGQ